MINKAGEDALAIKLSDALAYIPMTEKHRWLINTRRLHDPSKIKRKDKVKLLHDELVAEKNNYPELKDVKGDPGLHMITRVSQLLSELTTDESELVVCFVSMEDLIEFVYSHLDYDFFKRFKKKLPALFEEPEQSFFAICNKYSLIGRYSWNASVEKEIKEVVNMEFMEEYA